MGDVLLDYGFLARQIVCIRDEKRHPFVLALDYKSMP
jgi:hypothetical protein